MRHTKRIKSSITLTANTANENVVDEPGMMRMSLQHLASLIGRRFYIVLLMTILFLAGRSYLGKPAQFLLLLS